MTNIVPVTNIVLHIATVLTTNWVTVSTTIPATQTGAVVNAIYLPTMANQVGTIYENKVGRFEWNGTKEVVLESGFANGKNQLQLRPPSYGDEA